MSHNPCIKNYHKPKHWYWWKIY